jgi:hypothetical protein
MRAKQEKFWFQSIFTHAFQEDMPSLKPGLDLPFWHTFIRKQEHSHKFVHLVMLEPKQREIPIAVPRAMTRLQRRTRNVHMQTTHTLILYSIINSLIINFIYLVSPEYCLMKHLEENAAKIWNQELGKGLDCAPQTTRRTVIRRKATILPTSKM